MQENKAFKLPGSPELLGFDVDKHEWKPVKSRCCVKINGVLCGQPAKYEASPERLNDAAAFKRSGRNGKLTGTPAPRSSTKSAAGSAATTSSTCANRASSPRSLAYRTTRL